MVMNYTTMRLNNDVRSDGAKVRYFQLPTFSRALFRISEH